MGQIDHQYYETRAEQERARANAAKDRAAASAHRELAQHYEALLARNARPDLNIVAG
jgi:hypothetical protein